MENDRWTFNDDELYVESAVGVSSSIAPAPPRGAGAVRDVQNSDRGLFRSRGASLPPWATNISPNIRNDESNFSVENLSGRLDKPLRQR